MNFKHNQYLKYGIKIEIIMKMKFIKINLNV